MSVIVVVVIGFIMVGTKQHENVTTIRRQAFVKLKDCQFGCNSRATTKGAVSQTRQPQNSEKITAAGT